MPTTHALPRPRMPRLAAAVIVGTLVLALVPGSGAAARAGAGAPGRPPVPGDARPGPDALYRRPPRAPQLENTGPWRAEPILISGTSAYRDGEWLYQDFLFDDHGATGVPGRTDPYGISTNLYSPSAGTFLYPTAEQYAYNAADLVEFRVRPLAQATAFRVTLNTMVEPGLAAFTVALGGASADVEWPHGAGVSSPADAFLTVHGTTAELRSAAGDVMSPAPRASVDLARRQVEVRIPHQAWNPGSDTVRLSVGVGLWDAVAGTYLEPKPGEASATTPGGGTPAGTAIINVGPRYDEPLPVMAGLTMGDTAAAGQALAPWWRERQQSLQLSQGDVSPFFAEVDFGKLRARVDDDSGIPTTGPMNRIMASSDVFGQGVKPSNICYGISAGIDVGVECVGRYVGQLQPYSIYVPEQRPAGGYGLTLLLHSLSANYNQYTASRNQSQLGDRGSIVITPEARGPDGFYKGVPEANTFEVWADVARRYPLDPEWVSVTGYSMGGYGTYRLLARYPDLFARGFSVVGVPGTASDQLLSLRNTPVMAWNAMADELVNINSAESAHRALVAAGVDHQYWQFPADHLTLAANDEYQPGAEFLGEHRIDRNPATVAFVVDPREDSAGVVADHAYWLSGLTVRDATAAPTGTIEVHSHAFGVAEPATQERSPAAGVLVGGQNQAMPYVTRGLSRTPGAAAASEDALTITATNVSHVTVDPARARVSCGAELRIESDGPLEVQLAGCPADTASTRAASSASETKSST